MPGAPDRKTLWRSFAHALIPIAFAYLLAHYFSLFFFQEQAQFTYLLSDPLGTGTTDLFGTAELRHRFQRDQQRPRLVRPGGNAGPRPRGRTGARPRPRDQHLGRLPEGGPVPVLDAGSDGRVHLFRPVPALSLELVEAHGDEVKRICADFRADRHHWCFEVHQLRDMDIEALAQEICRRQHGVVSRKQLLSAGIPASTSPAAKVPSASPFSPPSFPSVDQEITQDGVWMAGVLAGGEGAVLARRSAAAAWDFMKGSRRRSPSSRQAQIGPRVDSPNGRTCPFP